MKRIVLIDDEKDIVQIIKSSLELIIDERISYHTFTNPIEAVKFIKNNKVDIVVTDLSMAKLSGLDVYHNSRFTGHVKSFIFLSGHIDDYKNDIEKINDSYFLEKPARLDKLASIIEECLKRRTFDSPKKSVFF